MPKDTHLRLQAATAGVRCGAGVGIDLREQKGRSVQIEEGVADVVVTHRPHDLH